MEMTNQPSAISRLCLLALLTACGTGGPARTDSPYDLILKNGWIIDGSGNPRYRGDVAITGDRIAAVGFLGNATARNTVDASGLVVAPGFIDMMGQSEINVLIDNRVLSKVTQGITTEVTGEGGSVAPLTDKLAAADSDGMKKWHYREDWRDLNGYFAQLERQGSALNIAMFVGATQVRLAVVGNENRDPTPAELAHMTAIVDTLMEQGALGVWTALEYAPASYSKTDELIALAHAASRHGGIYASHMRDEGQHIDEALNEVFRIAREAQIPAEVSHLKLSGRRSWGCVDSYVGREWRLGLATHPAARSGDPHPAAPRNRQPTDGKLLRRGGRRHRRSDHRHVSGFVALHAGQDGRPDCGDAPSGYGRDGFRHRSRRRRSSHRRSLCNHE